MTAFAPRIAYIASGAGGMYCGSCLRDNALAAALQHCGVDIQLIPTYTPIRTDEEDVSVDRVFFGGISVYLRHLIPALRFLPRGLDRILDRPEFLRWVTSGNLPTDAARLGPLTVSMLRGISGGQRPAVEQLVSWMATDVRPQLVNLSNMLIAGCVPAIRQALHVPILVTLQGDDIFITGLTEPYRGRVLELLRELVRHVDGFILFSESYAERMCGMFAIPREKVYVVPLGINLVGYPDEVVDRPNQPLTVGYLARICHAKGLHLLTDAFLELRRRPGLEGLRLKVAGWLGKSDRAYFELEARKLRLANALDFFSYEGAPDHEQKIAFLQSLDVLSVPTVYEESKGMYVLEALACGVPVVQPRHGAFPELLATTGGGRLFAPHNARNLADELEPLLRDSQLRARLGRTGHENVHRHRHARAMALATLDVYRDFLPCTTKRR